MSSAELHPSLSGSKNNIVIILPQGWIVSCASLLKFIIKDLYALNWILDNILYYIGFKKKKYTKKRAVNIWKISNFILFLFCGICGMPTVHYFQLFCLP